MARAKGIKRSVRCYLCGHRFDVSTKTLSTACPGCFSAIKVEDVVVKTYLPVTDLQTCGKITITRRGRVAARRIQCGGGILCEGIIEGSIETDVWELFNLDEDFSQSTNLADANPEELARLRGELDAWRTRVAYDAREDGVGASADELEQQLAAAPAGGKPRSTNGPCAPGTPSWRQFRLLPDDLQQNLARGTRRRS